MLEHKIWYEGHKRKRRLGCLHFQPLWCTLSEESAMTHLRGIAMGARTETIDPEELCKDVEGIDEMNDDNKKAAMKRRLNELIEGWNKNGLFITFSGEPPPSGMISFCLTTETITTPQRLIVIRLFTSEDVDAIDPKKRNGFLAFYQKEEVEKMADAGIRTDSSLVFPDGNMIAIITDK